MYDLNSSAEASPERPVVVDPALPFADVVGSGLSRLTQHRARRLVGRGDRLSDGPASALSVVVEGVACLTDVESGLCLAMVRPGGVLGPISAGGGAVTPSGVWLTDGEVVDLTSSDLAALPPKRLIPLIEETSRLYWTSLAAESVCSRRHQAAPRLARWILALFEEARLDFAEIEQSTLAELSGLQRTSVCAAMARLQREGGLKVVRGRVLLRNPAALTAAACRCGRPTPEPSPHRRATEGNPGAVVKAPGRGRRPPQRVPYASGVLT